MEEVREREREIKEIKGVIMKERGEGWIGPTPGTCSFLQ